MSSFLYFHSAIAGLSSYLLLMQWNNWQIPVAISLTHYLIDLWKLFRKDNLTHFLLDQFLHVLVIAVIWLIIIFDWVHFTKWINAEVQDHRKWLILLGFLFVVFPAQYLMKYATKKWSDSFEVSDKDALKDAGKWIGIFERILIFTFVMCNQLGAIGFLIAAKSFIRFSESGGKTRAQTEYILIGTLISFTIAIGVGVATSYMLAHQ